MSNQPKGYTADLVTQSLDITLRGPEESVKNVTSDNIRIVADLSEISNTVGTYTVRAKVYVDGYSDVGAVGDNFVTVTVTKG